MSFHLHLLNLREDATNQDLRQLFLGMEIDDDGVIITGGPDGEAFVTFSNHTDLILALRKDGEENLTMKVATDVDKLQAINRMCMEKLQKMRQPGTKKNTVQKKGSDSQLAYEDETIQLTGNAHGYEGQVRQQEDKPVGNQPILMQHGKAEFPAFITRTISEEGYPEYTLRPENDQNAKKPTANPIFSPLEAPPTKLPSIKSQYVQAREVQTPPGQVSKMDLNVHQGNVREVSMLQRYPEDTYQQKNIQAGQNQEEYPPYYTHTQQTFPKAMHAGSYMSNYGGGHLPMQGSSQVPNQDTHMLMQDWPSISMQHSSVKAVHHDQPVSTQWNQCTPEQAGSAILFSRSMQAGPVQTANILKDKTDKKMEATTQNKAKPKTETLKRPIGSLHLPVIVIDSDDSDSSEKHESKRKRLSDDITRTNSERVGGWHNHCQFKRHKDRDSDRNRSRDAIVRPKDGQVRERERSTERGRERSSSRDGYSHRNYRKPEQSRESTLKPARTPFHGSLFKTLLPEGRSTRYNILTSDLPEDVTASMVWSWVGGPQGQALGAILLKPSSGRPNAFLFFDNEADRDKVTKKSDKRMLNYTDAKTCRFISSVIKNWDSIERMNSVIIETTPDGSDRTVDMHDMGVIAEIAVTLPSVQQPFQRKKVPKKINSDQAGHKSKWFPENTNKKSEHEDRWFIAIYQMMPLVTATEVLSWFSDGLTAYTINFYEEIGPKGSDAIAFILFEGRNAARAAEREMCSKGYTIHRFNQAAAYRFMARLGDNCMITETTSGIDHPVSLEERQQPPFIPRKFTLNESRHMLYVQLKGFDDKLTASEIASWFYRARGVATVLYRPGLSSVAFVAFATKDDCEKDRSQKSKKKGTKKYTFHKDLTGNQALSYLAALTSENDVRISTTTKQDRKLDPEEEKLLARIQKGETSEDDIHASDEQTELLDPMPTSLSFYHRLMSPCSDESEELYVVTFKLGRECTACEVLSWFTQCDPVCAAKVNFFETGPRDSEGMGIILVKNRVHRQSAKVHCNQMGKPSSFYKRTPLAALLVSISSQCRIYESTSFGQDRCITLGEMKVMDVSPAFTLMHDMPRLYYAYITGLKSNATACFIWSCFGGAGSLAKGVILIIRERDHLLEAYVAFKSWKERVEAMNAAALKGKWQSSKMVTEKHVVQFLATCSPDFAIKLSTKSGQDRCLDANEQQMLTNVRDVAMSDNVMIAERHSSNTSAPNQPSSLQNSSSLMARQLSGNPTARPITECVVGNSIQFQAKNESFYIRLRKVPPKVTACELLSWYTVEGGNAKGVTLIRDPKGVAVSAYIKFAEEGHRDSAISRQQYAKPCTAHAWAARLTELNLNHQVIESTETGEDRTMTEKERMALRSPISTSRSPILTKPMNSGTAVPAVEAGFSTSALSKPVPSRQAHFYIRLRKVPVDVTAYEVLSWYTADGGHGKSATLVRSSKGIGLFAYVMFEEDAHRQSAMSTVQFAKPCTAHARGVCLAELDPDHLILESTGTSERCLTVNEREVLRKEFSPLHGTAKKFTNPISSQVLCLGEHREHGP